MGECVFVSDCAFVGECVFECECVFVGECVRAFLFLFLVCVSMLALSIVCLSSSDKLPSSRSYTGEIACW